MAKKDVYKYYSQCVKQTLDMKKSLETINNEDSALNESQLEYLQGLVQSLQANCDRLSYILFLLKKPLFNPKKWFKRNSDVEDYCVETSSDRESVLKEGNDILEQIRNYIAEIKKNAND